MTQSETLELLDTAFAGPGRIQCISLCVAAYDAAASFGDDRSAVVPIPSEGRIRIYAGNFNLVSPWKERLVFTTPRDHAATELLFGLGAEEEPGPKLFTGLAVVNAPRADLAPHVGLLLTGLAAAAGELAPASRCPRRHDERLEQEMRSIALPLT